ncbi:ferroptosis suppressor protein 1 [Lates calcarifer]|uniref:Ferroptosis suppressor protein 1 n=1 Tax=Lates calcarifer TaxID=8187 RepID=A0A4W6CEY3_LATCA|nr:apoptosis-inducing factor 2 [Lates calcarifer]XP_018544652.1 ferroptosis suppressor protein 1 [Lates calcarifer]XP_050923814.1 ferroptosis suppressor protein 1 [Lates calcarifer]
MGGHVSSASVEGVHVVVVGGGFGGIAAAQQLKSLGLSFTLIDLRDAFHHNVAALRASVQPGFAQRTFIPYAETFGDSFVQGRVERVDTDRQTVVLQGGREIQFSHLILCTGTDGPFPGKFNTMASYQTAVQTYEDFIKQVQAADSVLVVGGGSTGVEMAAEIKTEYPDKKVVLVHSRVGLADTELLPSVRQQVKEVLLEKGVELLLGQKVSNLSELQLNVTQKNMEVSTDKGETLTTDLIICCTGLKVNSAAYASSLSGSLAEGGALKVNQHLQVDGFSNIYAVGDCADVKEPKMAYHAGLHAAVAVSNIWNSLNGKELTTYQTGNVTMLLAMGRDDGVGQFNGFKLPRFLVALGKSRDLLLWKSWREMKQTQP